MYLSKDVNANATADGSIRVYAGLMDMMNDQELLGVIGHEIGHVKHAHTMSAMRTAYMASRWPQGCGGLQRHGSQAGRFRTGRAGRKMFNSQFSQSQETESDDYGLAFMQKHKYNVKALGRPSASWRRSAANRAGSTRCCPPTPTQARVPTACATRPVAKVMLLK